jgi:hypothetical protein
MSPEQQWVVAIDLVKAAPLPSMTMLLAIAGGVWYGRPDDCSAS